MNAVGGQDELVFDGGLARDGAGRDRGVPFVAVRRGPADRRPGPRRRARSRPRRGRRGPRTRPRSTARSSWAPGTTSARTGSRRSSWGSPGASTRRWSPSWRPTRWDADAVRALAMPSMYSSEASMEDAYDVAGRLGIRLDVVPITGGVRSVRVGARTAGGGGGLAAENLQARIRGNHLMAVSNRFGPMVLATGNKSEYAVGYSTLYGDMAGGFAPIKDVPKLLVYDLCVWRNASAIEAGGDAADPRPRPHEATLGRAAPGPAGHRLAPALRRPRPDHRGLRRGRPGRRHHRGEGDRRARDRGRASRA